MCLSCDKSSATRWTTGFTFQYCSSAYLFNTQCTRYRSSNRNGQSIQIYCRVKIYQFLEHFFRPEFKWSQFFAQFFSINNQKKKKKEQTNKQTLNMPRIYKLLIFIWFVSYCRCDFSDVVNISGIINTSAQLPKFNDQVVKGNKKEKKIFSCIGFQSEWFFFQIKTSDKRTVKFKTTKVECQVISKRP